MSNFELITFGLGIFSIVKGIFAHNALKQLAEDLRKEFAHHSWDRENPPARNEKWSTKSTPIWVIESRKNWDETKIKRDSAEDKRNFYFLFLHRLFSRCREVVGFKTTTSPSVTGIQQ